MKITITSTDKIVELNGIPARIWEGTTESGIEVHAFITRIAVDKNQDTSQFERELKENSAPKNADIQSYPLRMII
jgi:hypothetical protein